MAEINNIPIDSHNDWAKRIEEREKGLPEYQKGSPVTSIDVTTPSYPSQLETLLGEPGNTTWSDFPAPPEGLFEKRGCFSQDLISPSLGSQEKLEALKTKLESMNYGS